MGRTAPPGGLVTSSVVFTKGFSSRLRACPVVKALRQTRETPPVCVGVVSTEGMSRALTVSATKLKLERHQGGHLTTSTYAHTGGPERARNWLQVTQKSLSQYWSQTEASP